MTRDNQRGSAMLITMILIAAMLAGAAVLISLQLAANRSTDLTRTGISALYCAEAGLTASRTVIANNQPNWVGSLGTGTEPSWMAGVDHDIDDDGSPDFRITLEDVPGSGGTLIMIVSRCTKYPDVPKEIREIVGFNTANSYYKSQQGTGDGAGNTNAPF